MNLPRILVVTSNNFNSVTGGGITLTNLFRGWPADRIANLHEDAQPEDHTVCRTFYRLSSKEIRWSFPFSVFQPESNGTGALGPESRADTMSITSSLSRLIVGDGVPRKVRITESLEQWLEAFKPQLVYSFLGSMAQIRLTQAIARRKRLPVAVHIMDDWPTTIYKRGLIGYSLRRIVRNEFKAVLRQAVVRMGICQEMCEEYQKRYRYPFLPFHNALDMTEWLPKAKKDWTAGNPFVVRYVGSILAEGQRESLKEVCEAIEAMQGVGVRIGMWIQSPAAQTAYFRKRFSGIHFMDPPSPDTIIETLAATDLLVLPFNFDSHSAQYLRLSMPTKVPAYMASGCPVLVYGPPNIAPVRYAVRERWGYVLSQCGVDSLRNAIHALISDVSLREQFGRRAQALASSRHNAAHVRAEFQAVLSLAVVHV